MAAITGLSNPLHRYPRELSGGQRQRVAMSRAIIRHPKAFLFDEPLSNLDAALRVHMREEIGALHDRWGASSVYVTDDQVEAMTSADWIVAMHGGVVRQVGAPLELYDRPANLFVAGFIGSPGMNFLEATYTAGNVTLKDGTVVALPVPPALVDGAKVKVGFRPEHVVIGGEGTGMAASVDLVEPTGFGIILHLSLHGLAFKVFTLDRAALSLRENVSVSFPQQHLHVFNDTGVRCKLR